MATCVFLLVAGVAQCVPLDPSLVVANGVLTAAPIHAPQYEMFVVPDPPAPLTLRYVGASGTSMIYGSLLVFRNGLLMSPVIDYNLTSAGRVIVFTAAQALQPGDLVGAFYWR